MLTIDRKGLRETKVNGVKIKDFREISRIYSSNPKYSSPNGEMSIYLVPDNYLKDICSQVSTPSSDDEDVSLIGQAKMSSGRKGRKVKKSDIEMMRVAMQGNLPEEDLADFIGFLQNENKLGYDAGRHSASEDRKDAVKSVYGSALKIKSKSDVNSRRELLLNDLDWKDENGEIIMGELVPLPITNFTKEQINDIKEGKTEFYIKRPEKPNSKNECERIGWKKVVIKGDKLEPLIEHGTYNNEEVFLGIPGCDPEVKDGIKNVAGDIIVEMPIYIKYVPTGEEMVEITYIYGPNRSGKTYYAAKYAILWSEIFEDWPIFLFSRREKDKVLDDIPKLERIAINDSLVSSPLSMTDFEHSLVIFDDIDTIPDKKICKAVQKLRDDIMETGRQKIIYVINTSHLGANWAPTRTVLNEANSYTLFPRKGNYGHNFKILKDKLGMKSKDIRGVMDGPGGIAHQGKWGWVTVYKDSPQYLIFENGVKLI